MRNRRKSILVAGLFLAAVLTLVWTARPRSFLEVFPMDQAESFYVWTSSGQYHEKLVFYDAYPEREELEPLLELLEPGKLRLVKCAPRGRSGIPINRGAWYFGFSCSSRDGDGWIETAGFDLCTDGRVETYQSWCRPWPIWIYQMSDCDMNAIESELMRLLDIP